MSDRYSSSPALRLRIGDSRLRAALHGALCILAGSALWAIGARGYPVTCLVMLPPAVRLLWRLRRDPASGALLSWRSGLWTLERCGARRVIVPGRRCIATPWAIYLEFTDVSSGASDRLWLYADSAPPAPMRQLRVRLVLMH